jgi:putative membrane protein
MVQALVIWIVTTVSLLIISRLPLGIEIDHFSTAIVAALVIGILNALLRPVLVFFTLPLSIITFGLFLLVINAIIFGLAAWLIRGFRLSGGFLSALIGSVILSILNTIIFAVIR